MSSHQFTRPEGTGGKSILGSDDKTPLNQLECFRKFRSR